MNFEEFKESIGLNPAEKWTGYIPYKDRTPWQQDFSNKVLGRVKNFNQVNPGIEGPVPDICLLWDLAVQVINNIGFIAWQLTGSCVGVAGATSDYQTQFGDIIHDKKNYEVKFTDPFPTWGKGRQLGNLGGPGDGSFGAVQIEAENEFGTIEHGTNGLSLGTIKNGCWLQWPERYEYAYSWPSKWPIKESVLAPIAKLHTVTKYAKVSSLEELEAGFAQGYGATQASDWGCSNPKVNSDGLLVGKRNTTWNHQTWLGGFVKINGNRYWLWGNQWGPDAHPKCPFLMERFGKYGYNGGVMWIDDKEMMYLIKQDEVFLRHDFNGFPGRKLDWSNFKQKIHLT